MSTENKISVGRDEEGKIVLNLPGLEELPEEAKSQLDQLMAIIAELQRSPSPTRVMEIFQQMSNLCPPEVMNVFNGMIAKLNATPGGMMTPTLGGGEELFKMLEDTVSVANNQARSSVFDPEGRCWAFS